MVSTVIPGMSMMISRDRSEVERQPVQREVLALPVTALTTAGVTLYTVPDAAVFQIGHFIVTNYSTGAETFDLHIVPSGGSAGNSNVVYSGESVAADDTASPVIPNSILAPAGSAIVGVASTNSTLNITMHGMTIYSGDPM